MRFHHKQTTIVHDKSLASMSRYVTKSIDGRTKKHIQCLARMSADRDVRSRVYCTLQVLYIRYALLSRGVNIRCAYRALRVSLAPLISQPAALVWYPASSLQVGSGNNPLALS